MSRNVLVVHVPRHRVRLVRVGQRAEGWIMCSSVAVRLDAHPDNYSHTNSSRLLLPGGQRAVGRSPNSDSHFNGSRLLVPSQPPPAIIHSS